MATRVSRRLPGFRFETQPPDVSEPLPRMDVAAFVGFAASGPLHTPVAVDDVTRFAAIFGSDALLAWDPERGEEVRAHLAPAVRSFFENGGRRAWIVRVAADTARTNDFPVPGLAAVDFDVDGNVRSIAPALARARSAGSWSDALEIGAGLLTRPCTVTLGPGATTVDVRAETAGEVASGDLLRVTFGADVATATHVMMLAVA